jgi:peptidoglycan/xylan/chitin deacetylase (PgdA/CDA1 family)
LVTNEVRDRAAGDGRVLSLTFDDGPDPRTTPRLLEVLAAHAVPAVFFLWGDHVLDHPAVVRDLCAAGHVLGNHSMHHDDLAHWSPDDVRADLVETSAAIAAAAPGAPVPWFRAPYGSWGTSPDVAASLGMQPLGWQLAVGDWELPGVDELVRRVETGIEPGGVLLLHDGGGDRRQTVDAVERLLPRLLDDGWSFTLPASA